MFILKNEEKKLKGYFTCQLVKKIYSWEKNNYLTLLLNLNNGSCVEGQVWNIFFMFERYSAESNVVYYDF